MPRVDQLVITCEHGGNRIPAAYRHLFIGRGRLLNSHRGYDPGALELARSLARAFRAPLVISTTSRLLIDLNRSLTHPSAYSPLTSGLSQRNRDAISDKHYLPYRAAVKAELRRALSRGRTVLHLSVHTFTPILRGEVRTADIGLLYDPARPSERRCCARWRQALAAARPDLRIRRNYPYLGTSDGFTTALRSVLPPARYLGVEIEVNQKHPRSGGAGWRGVQQAVVRSLSAAISGETPGVIGSRDRS